MLRILLSVVLSVAILPTTKCFAHPAALPIPNARPNKNAQRWEINDTSSTTSTTAKGKQGKSVPISGTPFRGISRRLSSTSTDESTPPSQLESIVANAKSLLGTKIDLTNPKYLTAITAGLAVSLAMVPEAVSFSCK